MYIILFLNLSYFAVVWWWFLIAQRGLETNKGMGCMTHMNAIQLAPSSLSYFPSSCIRQVGARGERLTISISQLAHAQWLL